ncbi:hypothetical protein [Marinobacter sp. F4218]|uniref:hypothetical protein n=1 Tax=Marinobacter sp. F4218 TaxID=2862868 RepID=UPI001C62CF1D|nr:hypothetical protein [Marinobacter sp. F4218]MBW7472612.1 hypothetical protein [Marinobacter sp. F4218]
MKKAAGLAACLALVSLNGWSGEIDYDKRNMHIFCASHLSLISESLDDNGDQQQALMMLSNRHRKEARKLGATRQHFDDVGGYLNKVRRNHEQKWSRLTAQSKRVCLPNS